MCTCDSNKDRHATSGVKKTSCLYNMFSVSFSGEANIIYDFF